MIPRRIPTFEGGSGRLRNAMTVVSFTTSSMSLYRDLKGKIDNHTLYMASIAENAYCFPEVMKWLNMTVNPRQVKFINEGGHITRLYDSGRESTITLGGHKIKVRLQKPDLAEGTGIALNAEYGETMVTSYLVFTSRSRKAIDYVEAKLEELSEQRSMNGKRVSMFSHGKWGWNEKPLTTRNLDSVFLPPGVKEDIVEDLRVFDKSEDKFNSIGIPYHRGYLFYGPPGTGKSSLVSALASSFKKNLYLLPLSTIEDDKALMENINGVKPGSILLIEDVDIFSKTMKRESNDSGPSLAGLLNALDGVATPHGLVTVMTTNNIEALDDALIRPGRVDKRVELCHPVSRQIEDMFEYVYGEPIGYPVSHKFESMAAVTDVFKRHAWDAEAARLEIKLG